MTIHFTPEAGEDLEDALRQITRENPRAAARVAERIFSVLDRLAAEEFDGPETRLTTGEVVNTTVLLPASPDKLG